jgi:Rrf2 family protein
MWLSSTAQQALHAVLCIAEHGEGGPMRVDAIAAVTGAPRNYLSKTLYQLALDGVLDSERGPKGGFRLAVPANRLSIARVIAPFEPAHERRCLIGRPTCSDANPCAAHGRWKHVAASAEDFFRKTTVGDLLDGQAHATAEAHGLTPPFRKSNRRLRDGSST